MNKFIELNGRTYDANAMQQLDAEIDLLLAEQQRLVGLLQAQAKVIQAARAILGPYTIKNFLGYYITAREHEALHDALRALDLEDVKGSE